MCSDTVCVVQAVRDDKVNKINGPPIDALALVMSQVADSVVYLILLVPPAFFYVQRLGSQILALKCKKLEFV